MSSVFGSATNLADGRKTFNFSSGNQGNYKDTRRTGNGPSNRKTHVHNGQGQQRNNRPEKRKNERKLNNRAENKNEKLQKESLQSVEVSPHKQTPLQMQSYTEEDILKTGPLFPNPEALGFAKKDIPPRPVPKYLISQPRLLTTPVFIQNDWDKQNQQKMLEQESASLGSDTQGLYEEFQRMREVERKQMESFGLVDAENTRKDLNDAISFSGSCTDMCPIFERVRRSLENNVKNLEKDPTTQRIARERAVKAFSRPAAGQPPPLPSDVRPPHVLVQTLNYLIDNIVHELPEAHSFIWDRTRSIRQDFTYQNSFGPEAIECNERIVRIHLLSLHIMAGSDVEYSQQQELEQLNKALQTLMEIYDDVRNHGGRSPNEPEFRAYHLLSHIRDPELERELQDLPDYIYQDGNVQLALKLRNLVSQNNIVERGYSNSVGALNMFVEFFRTVYGNETPFLFGCILETHFNEIRFYALKSMSRSYHTRGKAYSAEVLKSLLGFDSVDEVIDFVQYYEIDVVNDETNGEVLVDLFNKEKLATKYKLNSFKDKPKKRQSYSEQLSLKIKGKSLKDFINQGLSNRNLGIKQLQKILDAKAAWKSIQNKKKSSQLQQTEVLPQVQKENLAQSPLIITNMKQEASPINQFERIKAPPTQNNIPSFGGTTPFTTTTTNTNVTIEPKKQVHFTPNPITSGFNASAPIQNQEAPKMVFGNQSKPLFTPAPAKEVNNQEIRAQVPKIDNLQPTKLATVSSEPNKQFIAPKPVEPVKKKLKDNPLFSRALEDVYESMQKHVVQQELHVILPQLLQVQRKKFERQKIIESLANELYLAFISELIYQEAMELKATVFYEHALKRRALKLLSISGSRLKEKHDLRRRKENELNSIDFGSSQKRKSTIDSNASVTLSLLKKRRLMLNSNAMTSISQRQRDIQSLWTPLDLANFVQTCSEHLRIKLESHAPTLQFLVIVENWTLAYSKWLNTKLLLKANIEKGIYERTVNNNKLALNITSLPSNNYLNKDFFSKTAFILFECGVTASETGTCSIYEKLAKDRKVLLKIASLARKYSHYKVELLIVFWDSTESGINPEKVSEALDLATIQGMDDIQAVVLCDMTSQNQDINEVFVESFARLENVFNGELTQRGKRKQVQWEKLQRAKASVVPSVEEDIREKEAALKANEDRLLKQAKRSKQYEYLKQHVYASAPTTSNVSTYSNLNSNKSSFLHASNRSLVTQILQKKHGQNYSNIFGMTTANSTTNNASILTGFGQGVAEESTPNLSPNFKAPRHEKPVSKDVQLLKDMTQSILARYKKSHS